MTMTMTHWKECSLYFFSSKWNSKEKCLKKKEKTLKRFFVLFICWRRWKLPILKRQKTLAIFSRKSVLHIFLKSRIFCVKWNVCVFETGVLFFSVLRFCSLFYTLILSSLISLSLLFRRVHLRVVKLSKLFKLTKNQMKLNLKWKNNTRQTIRVNLCKKQRQWNTVWRCKNLMYDI